MDSLGKSGEGEWIDPVGGGVGGGGDDVKTLNVELQQELFGKLLGCAGEVFDDFLVNFSSYLEMPESQKRLYL